MVSRLPPGDGHVALIAECPAVHCLFGTTEPDEAVPGRDASSWVSFPSSDRTPPSRNLPCAIDCRMHAHLPLVVLVRRVETVFLPGGWQFCVVSRASEQKQQLETVELLHHLAPLRQGSFPLSPTELTVEFAELLVEVAVVGWSRQCSQSLRIAVTVSDVHSFLATDDTGCQCGC